MHGRAGPSLDLVFALCVNWCGWWNRSAECAGAFCPSPERTFRRRALLRRSPISKFEHLHTAKFIRCACCWMTSDMSLFSGARLSPSSLGGCREHGERRFQLVCERGGRFEAYPLYAFCLLRETRSKAKERIMAHSIAQGNQLSTPAGTRIGRHAFSGQPSAANDIMT